MDRNNRIDVRKKSIFYKKGCGAGSSTFWLDMDPVLVLTLQIKLSNSQIKFIEIYFQAQIRIRNYFKDSDPNFFDFKILKILNNQLYIEHMSTRIINKSSELNIHTALQLILFRLKCYVYTFLCQRTIRNFSRMSHRNLNDN